jgi:hypothetical protein
MKEMAKAPAVGFTPFCIDTTAAALPFQQLRQLGDVGCNAADFVAGKVSRGSAVKICFP